MMMTGQDPNQVKNMNEPTRINELPEPAENENGEIRTDPEEENEIEIENENNATTDRGDDKATMDTEGNKEENAEPDLRPGMQHYNLWAQRPRDYTHLHATLEDTAMTQLRMKKGLRNSERQALMPS